MACLADGHARLHDADGEDVSAGRAALIGALAGLDVASAVLDGVVITPEGGVEQLCVVDLIQRDGESWLRRRWTERRAELERLLGDSTGRVQVSPLLPGDLDEALDVARAMGAEAVIAKSPTSVYQPGKRTKTWLRLTG